MTAHLACLVSAMILILGCGHDDFNFSPATPLTPVQVEELPGQSGELRFHLSFGNHESVDLDLHVIEPNGEHLSFSNPSSQMGGTLDVDCMCGYCPFGASENIYWAENQPDEGIYEIWVDYFGHCNAPNAPSDFKLLLLEGDQVKGTLEGTLSSGESHVIRYEFR